MIVWEPAARDDVLKVAAPPVSGPLPKSVAPSMKLTLPVAAPVPGGTTETVAVKVTDCPKTEGLVPDATLVVVATLLTTWASAGVDVPPVKLPSPL